MTSRSHRLSRLAALAALAALATAAPAAQAKTVTYKRVHSPSKAISCYAVKFGGSGIECHAPFLPDIGELDSYFGLEPRGKTILSERGDYPGFEAPDRLLRYGDVWKRPGIRCTMKRSGLTCRNQDRHGFHIARGDVRRF